MTLARYKLNRYMWESYGVRAVLHFDPRRGNEPIAFRHLNKDKQKAMYN